MHHDMHHVCSEDARRAIPRATCVAACIAACIAACVAACIAACVAACIAACVAACVAACLHSSRDHYEFSRSPHCAPPWHPINTLDDFVLPTTQLIRRGHRRRRRRRRWLPADALRADQAVVQGQSRPSWRRRSARHHRVSRWWWRRRRRWRGQPRQPLGSWQRASCAAVGAEEERRRGRRGGPI